MPFVLPPPFSPECFYVYAHQDPGSGEIVYVGCGSGPRAWIFDPRADAHRAWLRRQPDLLDVVQILAKGLTKAQALEIEFGYIQQYLPRFNRALVKRKAA